MATETACKLILPRVTFWTLIRKLSVVPERRTFLNSAVFTGIHFLAGSITTQQWLSRIVVRFSSMRSNCSDLPEPIRRCPPPFPTPAKTCFETGFSPSGIDQYGHSPRSGASDRAGFPVSVEAAREISSELGEPPSDIAS